MGIFTNYDKLIKEINAEWQIDYNEYQKRVQPILATAQKACNKYNAEIGVINADRHAMREEINTLYYFLGDFGNIGEKITPFDFITESANSVSGGNNCVNFNNNFDDLRNENRGYDIAAAAGVAATVFISTVAAPVVVIAGIKKKQKEKERYEEILLNHQNAKIEYENNIQKAEHEVKFFEEATEIAILYRNIVATVRDAIKQTVMPELSAIKAFLYADAIASKVAYNEDISVGILPTDITELQDTRYNEHFLFVKNTFEYYKLITKFFTQQILTQIIEDRDISNEEKVRFNNDIQKIKQQGRNLTQNAVFNKEN